MSKPFSLGDKPKKNIKDGLQVGGVGAFFVIAELVSRIGFDKTWSLGGISASWFGGGILLIGAVMTTIGMVRRKKEKKAKKKAKKEEKDA